MKKKTSNIDILKGITNDNIFCFWYYSLFYQNFYIAYWKCNVLCKEWRVFFKLLKNIRCLYCLLWQTSFCWKSYKWMVGRVIRLGNEYRIVFCIHFYGWMIMCMFECNLVLGTEWIQNFNNFLMTIEMESIWWICN